MASLSLSLQASMQALIQSQSAQNQVVSDLATWLRSRETSSIVDDLASFKTGDLLLPVYGLPQVKRLSLKIQEPCQEKLKALCRAIETRFREIVIHYLGALAQRVTPTLSAQSVYASRSIYATPPLPVQMMEDLRQGILFRIVTLEEARFRKLHLLPKLTDDKSDTQLFFAQEEEEQQSAICLLYSWLAREAGKTFQLPAEEWLKKQILLLKGECWPGVSFLQAVELWGEEAEKRKGEACAEKRLANQLLQLAWLYPKADRRHFGDLQCRFYREAGTELPGTELQREDTFQAFIIFHTEMQMLHAFLQALGPKSSIFAKDNQFLMSFLEEHRVLFEDERIRPYLSFFMTRVAKAFLDTSETPLSDRAEMLYSHLKERVPSENPLARSLLFGMLLFVYLCRLNPQGIALYPMRLRQIIHALGTHYSAPESVVRHDINLFQHLHKWTRNEEERFLLAIHFLLGQFGLQLTESCYSFSDHLYFLYQAESLTQCRFTPSAAFFLLDSFCLKHGALQLINWYTQLKQQLIKTQSVTQELVGKIGAFTVETCELVRIGAINNRTKDRVSQLNQECYGLFFYALLPGACNWIYTRFLLNAIATVPERQMRERKWAEVHNCSLRELAPHNRAIMCSTVWLEDMAHLSGFRFRIFWLQSLECPETRLVEIVLPVNRQMAKDKQGVNEEVYSWATLVCEEHMKSPRGLENCPSHIRELLDSLRSQMRDAFTGTLKPFIRFDEQLGIFSFDPPTDSFPKDLCQVRIEEKRAMLTQALHAIQQNLQNEFLNCAEQEMPAGTSRITYNIKLRYTKSTELCMGNNDNENRDEPVAITEVQMYFAHTPRVNFVVRYTGAITIPMLCWQLSVLLATFYRGEGLILLTKMWTNLNKSTQNV